MKKLFCIAILLLFGMLIVPVDGGAVPPAPVPVSTNANKLKNVKPTVTKPTQKSQSTGTINEKQRPSIEFKSTTITTDSKGRWYWEVKITSPQKRRVEPNTAQVLVWQNAGGKKTLLERRIYDRPIYPGYGMFRNNFYPSGESDTLEFELIERRKTTKGLTSNQDKVVDRATVAVAPFGIEMTYSGYSWAQEPAHFYAELKNSSPRPMRVRWVIQAGGLSHWTDVIHNEVVLLQKNSTLVVNKDWPFTEKGAGYYKLIVKMQLLDPATGKVNWTEITSKKGNLPTNR
jgi:hypothetical protein